MQLCTNPRKAIEELICNSYDAGANKCYVKIAKDTADFLGVLDNGSSMDFRELRDIRKMDATLRAQWVNVTLHTMGKPQRPPPSSGMKGKSTNDP